MGEVAPNDTRSVKCERRESLTASELLFSEGRRIREHANATQGKCLTGHGATLIGRRK